MKKKFFSLRNISYKLERNNQVKFFDGTKDDYLFFLFEFDTCEETNRTKERSFFFFFPLSPSSLNYPMELPIFISICVYTCIYVWMSILALSFFVPFYRPFISPFYFVILCNIETDLLFVQINVHTIIFTFIRNLREIF